MAAVSLLLLVVVSFFAFETYRAKQREEQARGEMQRRRHQAEQLIDFMLGDLRGKLQPIGKLEILSDIGDQAMEYFAAVREEELSDEELSDRSTALHQIGQVRFGLGQFPEASEAFRASLELARDLTARAPEDAKRQFDLGQSHFWLGFLRWQQRDLEAALEHFETYLEISRRLVEKEPQNATWLLELAYSYSNVGSIEEERGRPQEAARTLESSAGIFEDLVARRPGDLSLAAELAQVYAKLGQALYNEGELSGSLSRFRSALEIYQRAVAERPDDVKLLGFLGVAYDHIGDLLLATGRGAEAFAPFRAGLMLAEELVRRDPENRTWRADLAQRHNKVGRSLLLQGDVEGARGHLREELGITVSLLDQAPEHGRWRFDRARNRWNWALLHSRTGSPGKALKELAACREILESLLAESDHQEYRFWMARTLWLLGTAEQQLAGVAAAARSWREGAVVAQTLVRESPSPRNLDVLVRLLILLEREEEAEPWLRRLVAMGYREPTFVAFLDRRGLRPSEPGQPS